MKIYFAGSIRGGRDDADLYFKIIEALKAHGEVLTEHIGDAGLSGMGEARTSKDIFDRDMEWVRESDAIVAEVTQPSLGVGYELGQAEATGKRILALYRESEGKRLSAMIDGNSYITVRTYQSIDEVRALLADFFRAE